MDLKVIQLLSSERLRADPRNHTIPLLEVLDAREWSIIVTPEWGVGNLDRCASIEEYLEYARQLFEVSKLQTCFPRITGFTAIMP
jgi:hypothetical protein